MPAAPRKKRRETYVLRVAARFESAHALHRYKGVPEPLHGHSYKIEARFAFATLEEDEYAADFLDLDAAMRSLATRFDHKNVNQIPPFNRVTPTAENIAKWFYDQLAIHPVLGRGTLREVELWEGPDYSVTYSRS